MAGRITHGRAPHIERLCVLRLELRGHLVEVVYDETDSPPVIRDVETHEVYAWTLLPAEQELLNDKITEPPSDRAWGGYGGTD